MPNHFHAIIRIGENEFNTQRRDAMYCVSTPDVEPTGDLDPKHGDANQHLDPMHCISTTETTDNSDTNSPRKPIRLNNALYYLGHLTNPLTSDYIKPRSVALLRNEGNKKREA